MLKALNSMVRGAWLWSHLAAAAWHRETGRFFVFQDSPDLVVRFVCIEFACCLGIDETTDNLVAEARSEWRLRVARRKRAQAGVSGQYPNSHTQR